MQQILFGLELECHLLDERGDIVCRAPDVLGDPRGSGFLLGEGSRSIVEIISPPAADLAVLARNFAECTERALAITADYGMSLLPASSLGPNVELSSNDDPEHPRYLAKKTVLGSLRRSLEYHLCGTHVHVDWLEDLDARLRQVHVTTALDPLFALLSTSPLHDGWHVYHVHRVHLLREVVFGDLPLQGALADYSSSLTELATRQHSTLVDWQQRMDELGVVDPGFRLENAGWGPVKPRAHTLEMRSPDANLLSNVFGVVGVLGACVAGLQRGLQVEILPCEAPAEVLFTLDPAGTLLLPSFETLRDLQTVAIQEGIHDSKVWGYLGNVLGVARELIDPRQSHFLDPLVAMHSARHVLADEILERLPPEVASGSRQATDEEVRHVRRDLARWLKQDVQRWLGSAQEAAPTQVGLPPAVQPPDGTGEDDVQAAPA